MKRAIGIITILGLLYLTASYYQFPTFIDGECGLSNGPCEGVNIELSPDEMKVDHYIKIPNGQLAFMNIENNLAPILIKIDERQQIQWAKKLITETDHCDIPMYQMSNFQLETSEKEITISFFNHSFSEPGTLYLDTNYNFKMMCLKPF